MRSGVAAALVTGPVSKHAIATSGASGSGRFRGHTEHLAERLGAAEVVMAFASRELTTALVTTHLALAAVPAAITPEAVSTTTYWLARLLCALGQRRPRVAVAALNPHAGEGGLLGDEEGTRIAPGIALARARLAAEGVEATIVGPLGAETAMRLAARGDHDGVVAMYHDQATIPGKLLGFGEAVNVTLGLPIVRTSVDHGTAYDVAGTGQADPRGMREAITLAVRLSSSSRWGGLRAPPNPPEAAARGCDLGHGAGTCRARARPKGGALEVDCTRSRDPGAGTEVAPTLADMNTPQELIGRTFHGKFVITDILGEGAMGVVYRGFDEASLDEVAIKVLLPSLAGHEEVVTRFHREASAARRVDHESAVRVLGRGVEGGLHYLVMELLHGKSLATVLTEERRLPEGRALRLLVQLCGALSVAHERGVVHRDIKPENIMVIEGVDHLGERMKLLDFGIAKRMERAPSRPSGVEDSFNNGEETRHGALIGTPEYMAPEQCMGCDVDARTDLYACGVLLYRMVTGQVPFDGTDAHPFELCQRHIGEEPAAPTSIYPALRPAVEAIILKALRKAPSERYQTAVELRSDLSRALADLEHIEMEPTERLTFDRLALLTEAADLEEPRLVPITAWEEISLPPTVVEPLPVASGATTQTTERRVRRAPRATLSSYLPTVALAAGDRRGGGVLADGAGAVRAALSCANRPAPGPTPPSAAPDPSAAPAPARPARAHAPAPGSPPPSPRAARAAWARSASPRSAAPRGRARAPASPRASACRARRTA